MNISANNKYLRCISNRTAAIIYLVYILTGEVDTNDYYSTKKFIKYLILITVVLIGFCVFFSIKSNKQNVIDNYRKYYEKKHPNDLKLNDSEISKKYRYDKFIFFSIIYSFITFTLCLRQITYNEYIKEYNGDNLKNSIYD
ncbi:hypothetical protein BCR32DRAFT_280934 [Anaeromyces robustus]|uniref:Uncharacterized protein n=1 Tax=Anaeromyces robustus TaxID=1754192 RepID=A0A1Y1X2D5_9FUNG|nr:hypothetical protein BCR32DRAFT_280934 [Anaeromyces robustus]|eukprot:ORX79957.1 hypothetical protein BCR32DRAFT_280934 [Anaeromyces robustus]